MTLSLFESEKICLGPLQPAEDAAVEAQWTYDPTFIRGFGDTLTQPRTAEHIRETYKKIEKEVSEKGTLFYFAIRLREDLSTDPKVFYLPPRPQPGEEGA